MRPSRITTPPAARSRWATRRRLVRPWTSCRAAGAPIRFVMRRLSLSVIAAVLALATTAVAAPPAGKYKGKIDYQGYDVTFQVKGGKITKLVARMLQDCDRDGSSETITVAPSGSWPVK